MIERITTDNPLAERHAGMMAVLRNGNVCGPILWHSHRNTYCVEWNAYDWTFDGGWNKTEPDPRDIIAVMPMPDLSGLDNNK